MKLIADLHTHTIASTHAYATLQEMVTQAKRNGLKAMAVTDHAPAMPDAPHIWYFSGLLRMPCDHDGFLLLRGTEANVTDRKGTLDLPEGLLAKLDWVIVSMHQSCLEPMDKKAATKLWRIIAENPAVDMIGHSEQRQYPYDYDEVTRAFAKNNKVVEINANSPLVRPGNEENMRSLALACMKNGARISINSDAHSTFDLGNEASVMPVLEEINFPEELVINSSVPRLLEELERHGKAIALKARQCLRDDM